MVSCGGGSCLLSYVKSLCFSGPLSLNSEPLKCFFRGIAVSILVKMSLDWNEVGIMPSPQLEGGSGKVFFPFESLFVLEKSFEILLTISLPDTRGSSFSDLHFENLVVFLEVNPTKP